MPAVWCKSNQWKVTANVSSRASQEAAQRRPNLVLRSKQSGGNLLELSLRCGTVPESVGLRHHYRGRRLACGCQATEHILFDLVNNKWSFFCYLVVEYASLVIGLLSVPIYALDVTIFCMLTNFLDQSSCNSFTSHFRQNIQIT